MPRSRSGPVATGPDDFADWVGPSLLPMTRLARRLAPGADPADVVQEALVRAWRKREQFDSARGSATTWLLAITADCARAARRARLRLLRVVDDAADLPERERQPSAGDPAADVDLERAIAALPERQRLAVHLHYFLDLSVADAAAVMGCAPGTVKSTLYDARATLRTALGGCDDD